ncbi:hypothetical protein [Sinomonas humi]|uniref:Uncharacterized protein n=1 Tax=Sinomonas humi TaxID=1338436 RepID=A0A0B2AF05_9MICC|nr:hypothetical protein [Sinomonas humi]KHL00428.1 hypothetical protein LK10_19645 [Sinomonas humi]
MVYIPDQAKSPRPAGAKSSASGPSSHYVPQPCEGCGKTVIPHRTTGEKCPGRVEKSRPLTPEEQDLARLAFGAVQSAERYILLMEKVGPTRAIALHDAAKVALAERERGAR